MVKCTAERNDGNGRTQLRAVRSNHTNHFCRVSQLVWPMSNVSFSYHHPPTDEEKNEILNDRPTSRTTERNTSSYKKVVQPHKRRKSDEKGDWIHYECCRLKASIMCFALSNDDGLPAAAAVGSLRAESPPGTVAVATCQQHPSPTLLVYGAKPQGNGTETSYGRETRYSNAPSTGLHQVERL